MSAVRASDLPQDAWDLISGDLFPRNKEKAAVAGLPIRTRDKINAIVAIRKVCYMGAIDTLFDDYANIASVIKESKQKKETLETAVEKLEDVTPSPPSLKSGAFLTMHEFHGMATNLRSHSFMKRTAMDGIRVLEANIANAESERKRLRDEIVQRSVSLAATNALDKMDAYDE